MSLPWTAEQCEWLRAMGHAVFVAGTPVLRPADEVVEAPPVNYANRADVAASAPPPLAVPAGRAVERPRRPPPLAEAEEARDAPSSPAMPPAAGLRSLHRALLRAAGQRTARAAEAVLQELGVDTAAVQGDAAAKRALWVRLRARRRQGRP